jgi:Zn-dependent M16 (insulinase) family peptidase
MFGTRNKCMDRFVVSIIAWNRYLSVVLDVDHTCYTLTTAGTEGFRRLLPVYMDHILYPTLTDSGFYTEVHHINGEGEDAGYVYSIEELEAIILTLI